MGLMEELGGEYGPLDEEPKKEKQETPKFDLNKSWEAMYLVDTRTCKAKDLSIKNIPGWALAGGTSYTPPPPMPKDYRYAIWDMNPGHETHPDFIEWRRLESRVEKGGVFGEPHNLLGGVGARRHWIRPERDMFMFLNPKLYGGRFCPCSEHRELNGEDIWDIGWDNEKRRFRA